MENTVNPSEQNPVQPLSNTDNGNTGDALLVARMAQFLGDKSPTAQKAGAEAAKVLAPNPGNQAAQTPAAPQVPAAVVTPVEPSTETSEIEIEGGVKITLPSTAPKAEAAPVKYNTPQEAFDALGKEMGVQAATAEEFVDKTLKAFKSHRQAAQEAGEAKAKVKDIQKSFENMPPDLLESFTRWSKGEDYKEPFKAATGIDFNKSADKQDAKALINHFYPGKFTEEDFENNTEETPNETLNFAKEASIDKFTSLKSQRDLANQNMVDTQKRLKESFDASADIAVSRITEELPYYTDKAPIPAIEAETKLLYTLRGTVLEKYFLNADGTVLPGASARLAMLKDGQSIIGKLVDRQTQLAVSKATVDIVSRGADTPKPSAGHNVNTVSQVPGNVQKVLDMLPKKKSVYQ